MSQERWLLTVIATLVTDATWLYLLLALLGFTAGIDGAPLPWPVVFGLPMLAALVHLFSGGRHDPASNRRLIEPILGVAVIYWAVSVARVGNVVTAGFAWPLDFLTGGLEAGEVYSVVIILLAAAFLWTRGVRRANEPEPGTALLRSFRTGLVVFAGIICFEEMGDLDFGTEIMMLPFFAASLMGLAVSNSVGRWESGIGWLGFAAASVAAILATGLLVAILGSLVIRQSADVLSAGWIAMMTAFVAKVSAFIEGLALEGANVGADGDGGGTGALIIDPPGAMGPEWSSVEVIVAVMEPLILVAGTVVFVWLCRKLLSAPERVWPRLMIDLASVERESLDEGDTLTASDLLRMVIPGWLRARAEAAPRRSRGKGMDEVYGLYFSLLESARERGWTFIPSQTPFERAPHLKSVLASAPVDEITGRFVAACYGREPTSPSVITMLERKLRDAQRRGPAERQR